MNLFRTLKNEVIGFLQEALPAGEMTVIGEFPAPHQRKQSGKPYIAVGFSGVSLPACSELLGQVNLTLRFDILCPVGASEGCHAVFDSLCDALVCRNNRFSIGEITCGDIQHDSGLSALLLTVRTTLRGVLVTQEDGDGFPFEDIVINTRGV